jgi:hypothetical protein
MDIKRTLEEVAEGTVSVDEACRRLESGAPLEYDLGFAKVDVERESRCGLPEVIFGEGKTAEQIASLVRAQREAGQRAMVTRVEAGKAAAITSAVPDAVYRDTARLVMAPAPDGSVVGEGCIAVVSAGTSDLPVAEEAALTAEWMGARVLRIADVGVAGLSRLLRRLDELRNARVAVVVAGMEGALPSVVAGQVASPVIAVPTRVGYGWNLDGVSAFLAMVNSCAAGVMVVNLDNGFGAGVAAAKINRLAAGVEAL